MAACDPTHTHGGQIIAESPPGQPVAPIQPVHTDPGKFDPYENHQSDICNVSLSIFVATTSHNGDLERDWADAEDQMTGGAADYAPLGDPPTIDVTHPNIAQQRARDWPLVHQNAVTVKNLSVYEQVRVTGLPNMIGSQILLTTQLKYQNWQKYATGHADDDFILKGVRYGFPLQYIGGPLRV